MEPPEKVSAFLHIVRETIKIIQKSGFLDEHLDLWSNAINRNDKMKSLLADVEDLSAMYKTDNLKLETPLSEPELNGEIRYMLRKRVHVLSQSDSILRRTFKDSLALLQNSHPVLNLQESINELTLLGDAEDVQVLKDKNNNDNVNDMQHLTISDDKQQQQQQPSINGENHLKLNPSNIFHCSPSKTDPSKFKDYLDLDNFHRSKTSSSRKSKRHRRDDYYHDKYYPEKHAHHHDKYHHDQRYSNEKHRRRSRSSRHKESRSSRRGRSYSRSRSRSPSKRKSYERETSKHRSGKVKKKQDNYLRQISSEYHSKYDDLYKSYQNVVDDVSNKEREEFYKTKAN